MFFSKHVRLANDPEWVTDDPVCSYQCQSQSVISVWYVLCCFIKHEKRDQTKSNRD